MINTFLSNVSAPTLSRIDPCYYAINYLFQLTLVLGTLLDGLLQPPEDLLHLFRVEWLNILQVQWRFYGNSYR